MQAFLYRLIRALLRATVHRNRARELRLQRRLRASDGRDARQHSLAQAVDFANRMVIQSSGYRDRIRRDGVTAGITSQSWHELPILTKTDFRHETDSWFGQPVRDGKVGWTFTSGSTGEPFKFPVSKTSASAESMAMELNLQALGWDRPMRRTTIKVEVPQQGTLRRIYQLIIGAREIGFSAENFRMDQVPGMVERIRSERISYLRGYAASVYLFAQEVLRRGLNCPIPLIVTLGEGLTPEQAGIVERAFDGKVYRDYGASEAMHIGFECHEQRGYHVDLARFHIEILRDGRPVGPDESGDIIVTAFRNDAMPLVRYRIGDIGRWASSDAPCSCGNGFLLLAEVLGRSADVAVTPTGHLINLNLLGGIFRYALEHVTQYQLIQKEPDRFDVLWVARHPRAIDHIPELQRELFAMFEGSVAFDWHKVDEILPERSGKRRTLIPLSNGAAHPHQPRRAE